MKIGKLLKEEYGFTDAKTRLLFKCKYGYSNKFIDDMLNNVFPELNAGHLKDISEFTDIPIDVLINLQTPRPNQELGHPNAPSGKPFINQQVIGTIDIEESKCLMKK